jgi:hypothetical protein
MRAWFINLGPSSTTDREAAADINAILATEPDLLLGCEANGKGSLPAPHKDQTKIRDTSRPGRANLFAYVNSDLDPSNVKWTDCNQTFPRNNGPGQHWPRSIVQFPFQGQQIVVAHKPPLWRGSGPARYEHDRKLASILNPGQTTTTRSRSRLLMWDCNGMDGAETLADKVDARVVGDRIDCAIIRKITIKDWDYRKSIDGHKFATDHPWGALFVQFTFVEDKK